MANGKQSEQKEEHCESYTESYQPTRMNTPMETTFREFTWKPSESYTIARIICKQLDIKHQTVYTRRMRLSTKKNFK